ncbi:ORC1 [Candida jiufengensis]|uniref:ORC1 n=1 Tax=Candida jiufengensis TaxID=497108 RepID=UPI002224CC8F|nr:ORC1 [Candida jiufengensis]KAI5955613.1 ORC1 [Candida jiufengensis]
MRANTQDKWEVILESDQEDNSQDQKQSTRSPSRRLTRRNTKSKSSDQVKLRRRTDQLTVQVGDTVKLQSNNITNYALIKEIKLDVNETFEVVVLWFTTKEEIKNCPIEILQNEVLLTPYTDEININDVLERVQISPPKENENHGELFCQRATNEADKISEIFNYNDMIKMLYGGSIVDCVKKLLFKPNLVKEETKQKNEQKKVKERKQSGVKLESNNRNEESFDDLEDSDESAKDISSNSESEEEEEELSEEIIATPRKRKPRSTNSSPSKRPNSSPTKRPKSSPHKNSNIESIYSTLSPNRKIQITQSNNKMPLFTSPSKNKKGHELLDPTSEAFKEIKARLHTSQKLNALPGREDEFSMIYASLESAVNEETGCCIYISGVPGMGKTATIKDVVHQMKELVTENQVKDFNFIEINGLKLLSPTVAYSMLWEFISGDKVADSNAVVLLEEYFKIDDPQRKPLVILMDELDQIAQRKQNVMYNFFNWPTYNTSKLIVIAVANTMDLPERMLSNKISSRMGLRRIQFRGYTYQQLGVIIQHRLDMLTKTSRNKVEINADAIGFASRKVASVSGDARRALTICRRAVEIAENNGESQVLISHISQAINESINSPLAQYIAGLSFAGKLLLSAILKRIRRTGFSENSVGDVSDEMKNSLAMSTTSNPFQDNSSQFDLLYTTNGKTSIRIFNFEFILNSLVEAGILSLSNISTDRKRMISLNVSEDEVVSVLKRDKEVTQLL